MVVRLVECQLERMANYDNEVVQYRIKWFVPLYPTSAKNSVL